MTRSLSLFPLPPIPPGKLVVSYGGGVNSAAVLVLLRRMGARPEAIVMSNPGSEWQKTLAYRDGPMAEWLLSVGFPSITVITRAEEGKHREKAWRLESLYEECIRIKALPSIAYGWKKCSQKYKGETQRWWIERQQWAHDEWNVGRKLVKVLGYDADEGRRVRRGFENAQENAQENARFVPFYPLHDAMIDRDGCVALIESEGLPVPPKSACTFCPANTREEWERLRAEEPEAFAAAVAMSRNAELDQPDVVGLMRCNPHGLRQLHEWADGGHVNPPPKLLKVVNDITALGFDVTVTRLPDADDMPCECAL